MPIDTRTLNSPGWWFARLLKKLGESQRRYQKLDDYFTNEAGIPILTNKTVRESYLRMRQFSKTNFSELVVEAVRERMMPLGFRTGADGDELGDKEAWRIWQANGLDADSAMLHRAMLSMADAYTIIGPVDPEIGAPLITTEDPREVITEQDPRRRRKTIAALKVFYDEIFGGDRAYLYLPGYVIQLGRRRGRKTSMLYNTGNWEWLGEPQPLGIGPVVPVVRFGNRPDHMGNSKGEFETHLSILDRINYQILQRLEIVTLQAFRQRAIEGDLPTHDEAGNEIDYSDVFAADPGALWQLPATAKIWESGEVNLQAVHTSARDDVQDLAAVTRTPLFYLTPDAANGSAEGASLAREGLVFKTTDRLTTTSEPWEATMAISFLYLGDAARASRRDMEVIWASPERFSLAERYDAATKAEAAGVPWRMRMVDVLQMSPQQVERAAAERAADMMMAAALAPPQATPNAPVS